MSDSVHAVFTTALADVPAPLRSAVEDYWSALAPLMPAWQSACADLTWAQVLPRVLAGSDFVARAIVQQPELMSGLLQDGGLVRPRVAGEIEAALQQQLNTIADEADLKARLRRVRRREMVRIAFRDLAGWTDLEEVMMTMSELADSCLSGALTWLSAQYRSPPGFVVLGMGKLGGRELNFSSDIDLIFAYVDDGADGPVSHHEQYSRLGQRLIQVLSDPTGDGIVFRVDMRLRPHGASGPLVVSFDAIEQYYQVHGREWERYALIKARIVAGSPEAGAQLLARLKPFVYRRYLDYGAIESLRGMKALIAREVSRKGMDENIKLGPGGIREIEFIGQALQLIHGGRTPPLQERALLPVLDRLVTTGHLEVGVRDSLRAAYLFLRNTEHRLQMVADAQTHSLPEDAVGQARLAYTMGFHDWPAYASALAGHRQLVQAQFSSMFHIAGDDTAGGEMPELSAAWLSLDESSEARLRAAGYRDAETVLRLLRGLREGAAYRSMAAESRARLDRLVPLLLSAALPMYEPETTFARLVQLLEAIGRRAAYFALLIENPMVREQLVKLVAASPWIAGWIAQHLIVLDELLDPQALYTPLVRGDLAEELRTRLSAVPTNDIDLHMELLREFRHSHLLRVAAADLGPGLAPEQVGTHLADLAEVVVDESLALAHAALVARHGRPVCRHASAVREPGFAVIGYGKFGGRELGYASDLDMIFLYEECATDAGRAGAAGTSMTDGPRRVANEEFFARLGQRLIHFLTTRTSGGTLYDVDMRLRPSGQSGPLVTSLAAFRTYQLEHAWTWEHQALVRARAVAGETRVRVAFEKARREVLCRTRDPVRLRADVLDMRNRMREARATKETGFNLKHGRGGIVDIEFMVQYGVLSWAAQQPRLVEHTDTIGLLEALAAAGLFDKASARELVEAYRRYLSLEHRLKLTERGSTVDPATLDGMPTRVAKIWDELFRG